MKILTNSLKGGNSEFSNSRIKHKQKVIEKLLKENKQKIEKLKSSSKVSMNKFSGQQSPRPLTRTKTNKGSIHLKHKENEMTHIATNNFFNDKKYTKFEAAYRALTDKLIQNSIVNNTQRPAALLTNNDIEKKK